MPNHVIVSTLHWPRHTLEEAIASIAALDFGQVDLALYEGQAHLNPSLLATGRARRIQQEADRLTGLIAQHQMKRVTAFTVRLGDAPASEQQRHLEAVCDLAAVLEVPVVTLQPGAGPSWDDETLTASVSMAAARGVTLAVPARGDARVLGDTVALCRRVPGLGVTLITGELPAGPGSQEAIAPLLPFVQHVHLRDATAAHPQVLAGTGHVDFAWIVQALHDLEYGGKFAIAYSGVLPVAGPDGAAVEINPAILQMRDVFVGTERRAGIVRAPGPATPAP